jgi:hypothetical protein
MMRARWRTDAFQESNFAPFPLVERGDGSERHERGPDPRCGHSADIVKSAAAGRIERRDNILNFLGKLVPTRGFEPRTY